MDDDTRRFIESLAEPDPFERVAHRPATSTRPLGTSSPVTVCDCGWPSFQVYRHHPHQHDAWLHGVKAKPSARYETVATKRGRFVVTVVRPNAPFGFQRNRVGAVVYLANQPPFGCDFSFKVGLDGIAERQQHALLGRLGDRIVALLSFHRRTLAGYARWDQERYELHEQPGGKWAVRFMWVLKAHRRKGFAGCLLETALTIAGVPVHELAWEQPFSPDGEAFVKRYCPEGFWGAGGA